MAKVKERSHHSLHAHAIGMIMLLTIQYLLGILTNLFVHFPEYEHGGQLWVFAWKQIPLALHIIVGILLLFGTIALMIRSFLQKDRTWSIASSIGGVSVLGAVIAGAVFIPTQTESYSLIMAFTFLIALFSYFWGLYKTRNT